MHLNLALCFTISHSINKYVRSENAINLFLDGNMKIRRIIIFSLTHLFLLSGTIFYQSISAVNHVHIISKLTALDKSVFFLKNILLQPLDWLSSIWLYSHLQAIPIYLVLINSVFWGIVLEFSYSKFNIFLKQA